MATVSEACNGRGGVRWYEWFYVAVVLVLLTLSVFWMNPHRIGVVDLNKVARAVGVEARVEADNEAAQKAFLAQINQIQKTSQLEALKKQFDNAVEAQKQQAGAKLLEAQKQYNAQVAEARRNLQGHRELVLVSFRKRMEPVLSKIAHKRNLDVIVEPTSTILYVRPKIDLTDEAIQIAKSVFTPQLPLLDPSVKLMMPSAPTNAPKTTEE